MSITLQQTIHNLFSTATGVHYNDAVSQCTQVAVLTHVSKNLAPEQDFGLTGQVIYNGTVANFIQQQGKKLLSGLDDYQSHDVRFVFSSTAITDFTAIRSIFAGNLVARVTAVDDTNGYMTIDILRNRYGYQQFQNYLKVV